MASPWIADPASICLRLILSLVLGGIIGFERELNQHAAGFRTNILVCIGSTLIMLLSIYGFNTFVDEPNVRLDPARLAAQVISGIGFLGAGTIIRTGTSVKGLTTAATLWVMAAIGLAVGAGFYFPAILTCGLVFVSLQVLNKVELRYLVANKAHSVHIISAGGTETLGTISEQLLGERIEIKKLNVEDGTVDAAAAREEIEPLPPLHITMTVVLPKQTPICKFVERLKAIPSVKAVKVD
ncbi:MgtC/SapB family protein [Paenibacillus sp. MER TA 81-3]|uniref:MgtC/SapB family protein n=1 Tax=Paenibacillus sp. MER TA 81-3 TaxID=2939573 RepID=UPI0020403686|nr:MgtC/SapB family protein [Paenibacillus sp. MER TA 81-3]MCM3339380.1 MgtC/SapB family protein [Paenibacillus sp. MER TA 81-3]